MLMITPPGDQYNYADKIDELERPDDMFCIAAASTVYELTEVPSKVAKLTDMLKSYNGDEEMVDGAMAAVDDEEDENAMQVDQRNDGRMYSTDDLKQKVQASDKQTNEALKTLGAFKLSGYWRRMDR